MSEERRANRLDDETSPYLRQHRFNPVDWYPWNEEALEKARREDKPIFLSIGYSACHWCHVMERESFEDEETAALLNEHFVPVKVDREERPDLDDIYMSAVMMMTGRGGWPLNVFLTPDLEPFFGGTYFPPEARMGMPGFKTLLQSVAETWEHDRGQVNQVAEQLRERLQSRDRSDGGREMLDRDLVHDAVRQARSRFDAAHGGFSTAPKFPQAGLIRLLLHVGHRRGEDDTLEMATHTLERMAAGGIRDHLGGGFARYSVDEEWLVPHFEKMLYDNAQLAVAYLEAYQATDDASFARVAEETLDWMIRDMQDQEGGFYSSVDADSEGEEGKYYVWSRREVAELLGDDAETFCRAYDVTEEGNWEGSNILNRSRASLEEVAAELGTDEDDLRENLERCRRTLLEARRERIPPGTDDKVLVDWNGLAIAAMARAYRVLGEERFLESAEAAADFVFDRVTRDGRLLHTWREGESRLLAYLDDHANMIAACLELYESTFALRWLERARNLADRMVELFRDEEEGGFFLTGTDHEELVTRPKSGHDGSTPSGNGMAAQALLRLATLTDAEGLEARGRETIRAFQSQLQRQAMAHPHLLMALDYAYRSPTEIVVAGPADEPEVRDALRELWGRLAPHAVVLLHDPEDDRAPDAREEVPLLEGKEAREETPTFYVCEDYVCDAPTTELGEALAALTP